MGTENRDQELFDQEVASKGKVVLQVLTGLGVLAAVVMSMVALEQSGQTSQSGQAGATHLAASVAPAGASATPTAAAKPRVVDVKIVPESKKGPEGKLHDAYSVTDFHVTVGQPLTLHIDNTDTAPHSITSAEAGVNIMVQPGTHNYTLEVNKAGKFEWNCALPCDPWAMAHPGYMAGYIIAS